MAGTVTWDGSTSTDSSVAANWTVTSGSPSTPPGSGDHVIIPDDSTTDNDCTLVTSYTWGSLLIESGGSITTTSVKTVSLDGGGVADIFKNLGTITGDLNINLVSSSDGNIHSAGSGNIKDLTINRASTTFTLTNACTVDNDLTVTAGTLDTNSVSDYALTVTGDVSVTGTLTGNASAISVGSLWINAGGTYSATSGTTTVTSAKSNFAISNSGTFTHNNGTVTISGGSNQWLNNGPYYNLISNNDSSIGLGLSANVTVANDLTVNASKNLGWVSSQYTLTVTEDVICNGYLNKYNSASTTGACSFGSLTIASGGTYYATSGTTTITGGNSSTGYTFKNAGTFTHNSGKVLVDFTPSQNWYMQCNEYYDLEIKYNNNDYFSYVTDQSGSAIAVLGDLTVTNGAFEVYTAGDTLDIHGNTFINGGVFEYNADQTGQITHHGLVTLNSGEYKLNSGQTVKVGGFRRVGGTLTIS
mgnify:FL=1